MRCFSVTLKKAYNNNHVKLVEATEKHWPTADGGGHGENIGAQHSTALPATTAPRRKP